MRRAVGSWFSFSKVAEADKAVEMTDRIALNLGARRLAGGLEHGSGRGQVVVVGDAERGPKARGAPPASV
jgi:hypothetical protein